VRASPGHDASDRGTNCGEHHRCGEQSLATGSHLGSQRLSSSRDKLVPGLVAVVRLLGERLREHRLQPRQRGWLLLEVREDDRGVGAAAERRPPGQALVQQAAERVEVGAPVQVVTANLLGGDVVDSAERAARSDTGRLLRQSSGEPEVGQVAVATHVDQNVRRLDVAVHETALVRGVERVRDLFQQRQCALRREDSLLGQQVFQVVPSTRRIAM
jgi:hypothetical protein